MGKLEMTCIVAAGIIGSATLQAGEPRFRLVVLDASYVGYERDVADVNGDGANDLVCVSEEENAIRAFLAPDWRNVVLVNPTGPVTWPRADDFKVCDMDRDGDADLIVRLGPGRLSDAAGIAAWFENRGAAGWHQHTIGNSPGYVKDICVADLDRDGRPDVVMRREHETELYFQEPDRWTTVSLTHEGREGLEVADLDMDGDPDLILNGFYYPTPDAPAAARSAGNYVNTPIDSAWFSQSGDWTANACKVVVGDFDGDGRRDVAFSQAERAGHPVTWYSSPTPRVAGTWTAHPITVVDFCHNLQAADWDRDGDEDLLVGGMVQSPHRGLKFLLNGGAGGSWSESVLQSEGSYSAEVGDIDNDGDIDIVGIRNWNAAPTYIYRNETAGPARLDRWSYVQVSAAHERTFGLCFPDLDGDGDLDIASGRFAYRNPGAPLKGAWEQLALPGKVHAFASLDVDGDRFIDLLAQRDDPSGNCLELCWIESVDPAGSSWSEPRLIGSVPRSEHAEGFQGYRVAALFPGDKPGIVVSSRQGIHYFTVPAANPAAGNWPRTRIAPNDSDEGIGVADIDGDGHLDVCFTSGQSKRVQWARNPGRPHGDWEVSVVGEFPEADWLDCCAAADLNGDGRVDIIVTEENTGRAADAMACWWEQPAATATRGPWPRHKLATQHTMNNMDVADVDRDGDMDVVLAEHRGTKRIAVWANDGRGAFTEHRVGEGRESHLGGRLVDLDADGDLDLVSIAYDDFKQLHVWRNDSLGGMDRAVAEQAKPPAVMKPAPRPEEAAASPLASSPSLVAHWAFDERSGDQAADSGGEHKGRVVGATWATGRHGGGLRFAGQSDRVECGTSDVAGEAITMAAWIKCAPDSADNDARILSKAVGPQEQDHWWMLSMAADGGERRLRVRLKAGGATTTLIAARGNLAPDVWTHVAASYDGAHLRLFVDGTDAGSAAKTGRLDANPSAAVWIGANPPDGYAAFRGLIDDVRIYRSALTADGIAAVMRNAGIGTNRAASPPDSSSPPPSTP